MINASTEITCLASLEQALWELQEHGPLPGELMWWRGHADGKNWKLDPGVFRKISVDASVYERFLVSNFERRAVGMLETRQKPSSEVEWLFLAQHYGLPTRLLDWTENPLIALYFAVSEMVFDKSGAEVDGCLWAASPTKLNEAHSNPGHPDQLQSGLVDPENSVVKAMAMKAFGVKDEGIVERFPRLCNFGLHKPNLPKVLALASPEMDKRIIAQSGRFTIHGCRNAIENNSDESRYLRKFLIPAGAKQYLRVFLKHLGIKPWNVFPDLQALAKGLRDYDFTPNKTD